MEFMTREQERKTEILKRTRENAIPFVRGSSALTKAWFLISLVPVKVATI